MTKNQTPKSNWRLYVFGIGFSFAAVMMLYAMFGPIILVGSFLVVLIVAHTLVGVGASFAARIMGSDQGLSVLIGLAVAACALVINLIVEWSTGLYTGIFMMMWDLGEDVQGFALVGCCCSMIALIIFAVLSAIPRIVRAAAKQNSRNLPM